tara:strand:+ start:478 stop:3579 length:3102 start_codon:yes stop_codon:yes gene_type:complete
MSQDDRIRVVGYAQRVFYGDGIEYRNFSSDIVGNQGTESPDGNTSVFTFGNFVTTTNYEGRTSRIFSTNKFSNYYSLDTYNLLPGENKTLIKNNVNVTLNLDNSDLSNFVYFGSSTEFIRVTLEKIITDWPASLYLTPLRTDGANTVVGNTVSNYTYDPALNKSRFEVDTNFIDNKFNINYLKTGTIINTFNEKNTTRNLTVNFNKYAVAINGNEYNIISFSGANTPTNDIITIETKGDPFGFNGSVNSNPTYHIRPNSENVESFFNALSDYETNLLNRLTVPIYTSKFEFKKQEDDGTVSLGEETLSWPVSDGYNIDFDTTDYVSFVTKLLEISKDKDGIETNLMTRFLTAQAISDFDTLPSYNGTDDETAGQKMNRTLKIYGREFDEIKKYIDGISFANVVSYDKKKNTPDQLVKYLARVLGWELTSSIVENDLVKSYLNVGARSYAGYSRGLTPAEAEIELWRRLILNSSWIWKSKGTRKAIEFFFKLIGTPDGLIDFDEYVYVAKEPIDMDLFYATLKNNDLDNDLSLYNVDSDGYPKFLRDTPNMYFQKGGQWYRETAGENASQYILAGNNPHVGPYDGGKEYINQLENIIPSFTPFTLTSTTVTTGTTKLFTNYNSGLINQYTGDTYVTLQNDDGIDLTGKINSTTNIIKDPFPQTELTDCGCDVPEDDECLIVDIDVLDVTALDNCEIELYSPDYNYTPFSSTPGCYGQINRLDITTCWIHKWNSGFWSISNKKYDMAGTPVPNAFTINKFISPECCAIEDIDSSIFKERLFKHSDRFYLGGIPYYHDDYEFIGQPTPESTGVLDIINFSDRGIQEVSQYNTETYNYTIPTPTIGGGDIYNPADLNLSWKLVNSGYLCLRKDYSPPTLPETFVTDGYYGSNIQDHYTKAELHLAGPSPLISNSWMLNGPSISDMYTDPSNGYVYLKFKKPNGDFTITSDTDTGMFPIQPYGTPSTPTPWCEVPQVPGQPYETILDPYTGKVGYPCRLTNFAKNHINNNPTYTNSVYQTYLQRAIGIIGATDYFLIP